MRRVVFDPNVYISGLISHRGPPAKLLAAWAGGAFELIVSPKLLAELERTLARDRFRRHLTLDDVLAFVATLRLRARLVDDPPEPTEPLTPDPGDDYLVALARAVGADALVSGDSHLLGLLHPDPAVLAPRAFLDSLVDSP